MTKRMLYSYPGSKCRLAPKYAPYYPPHRRFVSVFGGTGAEIVFKDPSWLEVFNDKCDFVLSVFRVLQDAAEYQKLVRLVKYTPPSRSLVDECRAKLKQPEGLSRLEKAYAFLVCQNLQYGGGVLSSTFSTDRKKTRSLLSLPRTLAWFRRRFESVLLENRDWRFILKHYDEDDTFFFVDPPYHPGVVKSRPSEYYRHWLTADDHDELLDALQRVKGRVLLCGYNHPAYTTQLFYWRRIPFKTRMSMSSRRKKSSRVEQIWLNYEDDGSKSEDNQLLIAQRYVGLLGDRAEAGVAGVRRMQAMKARRASKAKTGNPDQTVIAEVAQRKKGDEK